MPKIKIRDLPEDMKVSEEELARVKGGMAGSLPAGGLSGGGAPSPAMITTAGVGGPRTQAIAAPGQVQMLSWGGPRTQTMGGCGGSKPQTH